MISFSHVNACMHMCRLSPTYAKCVNHLLNAVDVSPRERCSLLFGFIIIIIIIIITTVTTITTQVLKLPDFVASQMLSPSINPRLKGGCDTEMPGHCHHTPLCSSIWIWNDD